MDWLAPAFPAGVSEISSRGPGWLCSPKALERAVIELLSDHTELFKQFSDNPSFKKWLSETIFAATYADAS